MAKDNDKQDEITGRSGGAWDTETHKRLYPISFNRGLAECIVSELVPASVLEFGSGLGYLSKYINDNAQPNVYYCIEPEDLTGNYDPIRGPVLLSLNIFDEIHPTAINQKFELVLSIEVAEHIEASKHHYLFDFLVAHCKKWIVFSGAHRGQGGFGHIAERDEDEWRSEFIKRGMIFESNLTDKFRRLCDKKNINHRKNVMVFRRPELCERLDVIEYIAARYFNDLLHIVQSRSATLIGNLCYVDMKDAINGMPCESLRTKRDTFVHFIKGRQRVLLIGFNAGHSTMLALLANSEAHITIIDICELNYVERCAAYIEEKFPNRIKFIKGNSLDALPTLKEEEFDFIHYDAGKEVTISEDLKLTRDMVSKDHVLIVDDTQNEKLYAVIRDFESQGVIESQPFAQFNHRVRNDIWKHTICRFRPKKSLTSLILEQLSEIYDHKMFPSIYTNKTAGENVTGFERAQSLVSLLDDVDRQRLSGDFVECGVAAGHSAVIAALALLAAGNATTRMMLYDTFTGFGPDIPSEYDFNGRPLAEYDLGRYSSHHASEQSVRDKVLRTGFTGSRLKLVSGRVEDSIPLTMPGSISVLRLDMDLYQPTLHALRHLYPRLTLGGYLIIDDYGHWKGCKAATDEYFAANDMDTNDLVSVDYTCKVYRKTFHVTPDYSY